MYDLLTSGIEIRVSDIEAQLRRLDQELGVADADSPQAAVRRATAAQHAFRAWGWRKVARAQAGPDAPVTDVLVIPLG